MRKEMGTFINRVAIEKVEELSKVYEFTWGKKVDYTIIPKGITQEKMVKCLELMIESNLSLLVAYNKLYGSSEGR